MPEGSVAGSWARIVAVLDERAPASAQWINGPADAGTLGRLRSEIAVPLPPDLTEWLSLADGATHMLEVIPRFTPLSAEGIIAANRQRHAGYPGTGYGPGRAAGTETGGVLPEEYWLFIPVASGASTLVADLRDGERRGCLMEWYHEVRVISLWPSIAVMLAEIASALEHGRPEDRAPTSEEIAHRTRTGHLTVFTADGRLAWHDYDGEQAKIRHHEITAWARSQGLPVGERGRIPRSVVEAWERRQEG
jgi:hypothetical protein